jgi:hypothetical protein
MFIAISTAKRIALGLLVAALVLPHTAAARAEPPTYDLQVAFDVSRARITGVATIDVAPGTELSIDRGDLKILRLTSGGRDIVWSAKDSDPLTFRAEGPVRIRYEGTFSDPEGDAIGKDTIVLRGIWYPVIDGIFRYRLTATLPRAFVAVSEADRVRRTDAGPQSIYAFDLPYPQRPWDGVTFVASTNWVSREARYGDIDIAVHVFPRNESRLDELARQTAHYLQELERMVGKYPFKRLVVAENPLALHYSLSMPTYVLLTQRSVAAEDVEESALNHEIAHEWFGNGVLADYDQGNWGEGAASYFSDLVEAELAGRGWERRQRMMAGYQNNVADRAASPLSGFTGADDRVSRFIGYGKSALVFHMLRQLLGDERFFAAIRRFVAENLYGVASWADLRRACEQAAAIDLGWFFAQWVGGATTPELGLEGVSALATRGQHELRFTVTQGSPAFALTVPLTFHFASGRRETVHVSLASQRREFRFLVDEKPTRVVLDESYDVFRRLAPAEVPPRIDTLLTRQRVTLLAPPGEEAKFKSIIEAFEHEGLPVAWYGWRHEGPRKQWPATGGARVRPPALAQPSAARAWRQLQTRRAADTALPIESVAGSLIVLGEGHPLVANLFGRLEPPHGGFTVTVLNHPRSPGDVVAVFTAKSEAEVDAAFGRLVDRRRYSVAAFNAGKLIHYELRPGERGISREVAAEPR